MILTLTRWQVSATVVFQGWVSREQMSGHVGWRTVNSLAGRRGGRAVATRITESPEERVSERAALTAGRSVGQSRQTARGRRHSVRHKSVV